MQTGVGLKAYQGDTLPANYLVYTHVLLSKQDVGNTSSIDVGMVESIRWLSELILQLVGLPTIQQLPEPSEAEPDNTTSPSVLLSLPWCSRGLAVEDTVHALVYIHESYVNRKEPFRR